MAALSFFVIHLRDHILNGKVFLPLELFLIQICELFTIKPESIFTPKKKFTCPEKEQKLKMGVNVT